MQKATFVALLERDVDDISKAALELPVHERRAAFPLAVSVLAVAPPPVLALKAMRFIQAALAQERNARFPVSQARLISTALLDAAAATHATDVHRAAVDVMTLLAVKSSAERDNLAVLARLLQKSPHEPYGPQKARQAPPASGSSSTKATAKVQNAAVTRLKRTS
jgi:hypothetical protein